MGQTVTINQARLLVMIRSMKLDDALYGVRSQYGQRVEYLHLNRQVPRYVVFVGSNAVGRIDIENGGRSVIAARQEQLAAWMHATGWQADLCRVVAAGACTPFDEAMNRVPKLWNREDK